MAMFNPEEISTQTTDSKPSRKPAVNIPGAEIHKVALWLKAKTLPIIATAEELKDEYLIHAPYLKDMSASSIYTACKWAEIKLTPPTQKNRPGKKKVPQNNRVAIMCKIVHETLTRLELASNVDVGTCYTARHKAIMQDIAGRRNITDTP